MTKREKIFNTAKHPIGIAGIITVLGGGSFGGYRAVRDFVIGPIVVEMHASKVRENAIIKNLEKANDLKEIQLRLQYRKEDIKAVRLEMAAEREWD